MLSIHIYNSFYGLIYKNYLFIENTKIEFFLISVFLNTILFENYQDMTMANHIVINAFKFYEAWLVEGGGRGHQVALLGT